MVALVRVFLGVCLCALGAAAAYDQCPTVQGRMRRRDYATMDGVIVSIGMMCGTTDSVRRLLHFYNLRRVYYIVPKPEEQCHAINAIDSRVICVGERDVLEGNTTMAMLEDACVQHYGEWSGPTAKKPVGVKNLGWYLQQFVKLGVARSIADLSENYLVWDADNVLMGGNHELVTPQGQTVFAENGNGRYESNGYNAIATRLLGYRTPPTPNKLNYVTGHMVFKKTVVRELLEHIEAKWHMRWTFAVCKAMETPRDGSIFSEYQTYGSWVQTKHGRMMRKPTVVIDLVRNPPPVTAQVKKGNCCIADSSICKLYAQFKRRRATFYVILEEHKWRYRDKVCTDGWELPAPRPGQAPYTNPRLELPAP